MQYDVQNKREVLQGDLDLLHVTDEKEPGDDNESMNTVTVEITE